MRIVEWIRASQAILFEASILPAIVGTAAAIHGGAPFRAVPLGLILLSLIGIQAGANLLKGYFEGRDRSSPPSSPGSWFAFDSAAAVHLTRDPRTVLRLGRLSFAIGVGAGLLLVLLTMNLALLFFGIAGAVLAWSYSSPPLQLSYRGVGEISTFLAFGPIMTVGATVAFGGAGIRDSLFASVVLGLLASAISFARYFPNRAEDSEKGKRTPVTSLGFPGARRLFLGLLASAISFARYFPNRAEDSEKGKRTPVTSLGFPGARRLFLGLPLLPVPFGIIWWFFGGGVLWILLTVAFWIAILRAFPKEETASRFDRAIAWTVAAHAFVGLAIVVDLFAGL